MLALRMRDRVQGNSLYRCLLLASHPQQDNGGLDNPAKSLLGDAFPSQILDSINTSTGSPKRKSCQLP